MSLLLKVFARDFRPERFGREPRRGAGRLIRCLMTAKAQVLAEGGHHVPRVTGVDRDARVP